ncbi:hypothetical protein M011DRAFT_267180 [Sporormia fimetaria CBS 119925]|uniref:Uncharacterized protein n=1 Tax=Sporormia fimetaria CBS 119925 TaxID=1340428 RepID=A0A6A6UY83_9PLEO|nr:hypothetical protein M011DRAFT_267180 [Sporormia fimetaria CBS 119925]
MTLGGYPNPSTQVVQMLYRSTDGGGTTKAEDAAKKRQRTTAMVKGRMLRGPPASDGSLTAPPVLHGCNCCWLAWGGLRYPQGWVCCGVGGFVVAANKDAELVEKLCVKLAVQAVWSAGCCCCVSTTIQEQWLVLAPHAAPANGRGREVEAKRCGSSPLCDDVEHDGGLTSTRHTKKAIGTDADCAVEGLLSAGHADRAVITLEVVIGMEDSRSAAEAPARTLSLAPGCNVHLTSSCWALFWCCPRWWSGQL